MFDLFFSRIVKLFKTQLIKRANNRFVHTYLKECYTLTLSVLYSESLYVLKCRISVDKMGYPKIIPYTLRVLMQNNKNVLFGVLSVLGLHRVIKYEPKPDLKTITAPFNGSSKIVNGSSLALAKEALMKLASVTGNSVNFKFQIKPIKGIIIEKAGPNGPAAFRRIFIDAFALLQDFNLLMTLTKWYFKYGGKRYLLSLYLILLLGLPIILILKALKLSGLNLDR